MRKFVVFWILFILICPPRPGQTQELSRSVPQEKQAGLFVSVIQVPPVLSSRKAITDLIDFAGRTGTRTLFVQIYYGNKAWFRSAVGDPAPHETALRDVGEDPFALLIREAHTVGIEVHAWLNMLSLNNNERAPLLKKYGPGILTKDRHGKKKLEDYKIDGQYFLEPGDPRVRGELTKLVEEILWAYPELDGVQFDYLRYPDVHPVYGYADANVQRFKKSTGARTIDEGSRIWQDWRRAQVTDFMELLVRRTRAIRPDIRISVTGCMPYARAYHEAFQDWPSWLDRGLVDFVTVMDYSPDTATFERWLSDIRTRTRNFTKVNIAIGAYRLEHSPEIFAKEFGICEAVGAGTCTVFHYGSLLENPALQEPLLPPGGQGAAPSRPD